MTRISCGLKKEPSKYIHPVKSYELTHIDNTVELRTYSFLKYFLEENNVTSPLLKKVTLQISNKTLKIQIARK